MSVVAIFTFRLPEFRCVTWIISVLIKMMSTLHRATIISVVCFILVSRCAEGRPQLWFYKPVTDWNPPRPHQGSLTEARVHGPHPGDAPKPGVSSDTTRSSGNWTQSISKILTVDESPSMINPDFVFPDEKASHERGSPSLLPRVGVEGPKCAKGTTFCDDSPEYPAQYIESIVVNSEQDFSELFGEDHLPIHVGQRIDAFDEIQACRSREEVVFPTQAENERNQWLYVVNIKDKFEQGVRIELCTKEGEECRLKAVPFGYVSSCKQKYIYRKLVGIDSSGNAGSDNFKLPSCCSCYFKPQPPEDIKFGKSVATKRARSTSP